MVQGEIALLHCFVARFTARRRSAQADLLYAARSPHRGAATTMSSDLSLQHRVAPSPAARAASALP